MLILSSSMFKRSFVFWEKNKFFSPSRFFLHALEKIEMLSTFLRFIPFLRPYLLLPLSPKNLLQKRRKLTYSLNFSPPLSLPASVFLALPCDNGVINHFEFWLYSLSSSIFPPSLSLLREI
jgi:hypothetical protein